MPKDYDTFITYRRLGGVAVTREEIERELSKLPLDGVLGLLASISLAGVQAGDEFFDPRWQGGYLNAAIVDDFPRPVPGATGMYLAGRVPRTGVGHIFLTEQNLAWLTHAALLSCQRGTETPELTAGLWQRVCRLLLIANDLLTPSPVEAAPGSLVRARQMALNLVRHSQFNLYFRPMPVMLLRLARQKILFVELLPNHFPIHEAFMAATGGVPIEHYFQILALLVTHVDQVMRGPGNHWIPRNSLVREVRTFADEIERIFRRWIRTLDEYDTESRQWARSRSPSMTEPGFDHVPLRQAPLIETRPGEVVCPVLPFLLAKAIDEPYFLVCDSLPAPDRGRFQEALGCAYDEYAHGLVERIAANDTAGPWTAIQKPRHRRYGEIVDSLLLRGSVSVSFEHKGGRPGTEFIRGGEGTRVLGPEADLLERLEQGQVVRPQEGKRSDNGLFTRGLWQQSSAGQRLASRAKAEHGVEVQEIYSVISHLADLRLPEPVRHLYLDRLIAAARLYQEPFWRGPEWLHVEDLESLACLAEKGRLDLLQLLEKKESGQPLASTRFCSTSSVHSPGPTSGCAPPSYAYSRMRPRRSSRRKSTLPRRVRRTLDRYGAAILVASL